MGEGSRHRGGGGSDREEAVLRKGGWDPEGFEKEENNFVLLDG